MDRQTATLVMAFLQRVEVDPPERTGLFHVMAALAEIVNRPDEDRPDLVARRAAIAAQSGEGF
jgi:hypothetical protein